jgi:hypothetical protein
MRKNCFSRKVCRSQQKEPQCLPCWSILGQSSCWTSGEKGAHQQRAQCKWAQWQHLSSSQVRAAKSYCSFHSQATFYILRL